MKTSELIEYLKQADPSAEVVFPEGTGGCFGPVVLATGGRFEGGTYLTPDGAKDYPGGDTMPECVALWCSEDDYEFERSCELDDSEDE